MGSGDPNLHQACTAIALPLNISPVSKIHFSTQVKCYKSVNYASFDYNSRDLSIKWETCFLLIKSTKTESLRPFFISSFSETFFETHPRHRRGINNGRIVRKQNNRDELENGSRFCIYAEKFKHKFHTALITMEIAEIKIICILTSYIIFYTIIISI